VSADEYITRFAAIVAEIHSTQREPIGRAAAACAASIGAGRAAYAFGSGHSVIPVMDLFPRYGAYVGWQPIMDPRLMWFNVTGPGGARELLWLERREGYVEQFLRSYRLDPRDSMVVFSHGGMNAAPIEVALAAKEAGLTVIAVTSLANRALNQPQHASGRSLHDVADIVVDNCCPPEDALVEVPDRPERVGGSSTIAAMIIMQAIMAETTAALARAGRLPERIFVSPNVPGVPADNNQRVFEDYQAFERRL
jgi:uncharacterized phosphosugar-binding protein